MHVDGQVESVPGNYPAFYAAVRDALVNGGAPPVDPRDAVQTLRVIEAAQRSARDHSVVAL
jgi:scyllo-inositol 2-dehydrogenase (NADP+)